MNPFIRHSGPARTFLRLVVASSVVALGASSIGCESTGDQRSTPPSVKLQKDGDHEFRWGRFESAAGYYERILDREPGNADALEMYGRCMLELDRPSEAAKVFMTATARRPGDRDLVLLLAGAEFQSSEYDRAFQLLRTWAIDNEDADAWLELAGFAMELDDPDTARDAIERAIELEPATAAEAYIAAADLAERLGDETLALRRLRQAYGIDPGDQSISDRLREFGEVPGPTISLPPGV
jgi:tetratricopeptide (TPR) repeat protein